MTVEEKQNKWQSIAFESYNILLNLIKFEFIWFTLPNYPFAVHDDDDDDEGSG